MSCSSSGRISKSRRIRSQAGQSTSKSGWRERCDNANKKHTISAEGQAKVTAA